MSAAGASAGVGAATARPRTKLVFDLGGVVFRWQPQAFLPRLMPASAATPDAALRFGQRFFEGFGGDWGEFDRGRLEAGPLAERIAARIGLAVDEARRLIEAIPDELQPLPDTVALLRRLRERGHALFFLSNMPAPYARHLQARDDTLRLFDGGVFSSQAGLIKPEPALFAHAAAAFGGAPAELLLIDDIAANVAAARAAGWQALLFEDARGCEAALARLGIG
jgi:putative hydrolase of the HAD superfamily